MAAIMVLCIVLAAYAYLFLQNNTVVREMAPLRADGTQESPPEVGRGRYAQVHGGAEAHSDGLPLEDIS
jgi:hypothetical protein